MSSQEKILEEDRLVTMALQAAGVNVSSSQDLMRTREPYPKAIPVPLSMLPKVQTYSMKEITTRSVAMCVVLFALWSCAHSDKPLVDQRAVAVWSANENIFKDALNGHQRNDEFDKACLFLKERRG
jgi:hypothetical protein